VTFNPGQTTQTVLVPVLGDVADEDNETYRLALSNPVNASLAEMFGTGSITDNDAVPGLRIANANVVEGDTGMAELTFDVTLTAVSGRQVTVNYATANNTATLADNDYVMTTGTLTFPAGTTSQPIRVLAVGDATDEGNQNFFVVLSMPTNATLPPAPPRGVGTIINDDSPLPNLRISDATIAEVGPAGTSTLTFTATLSTTSTLPITAAYATTDITAVAGQDYNAATGTVMFAAGQTSRPITVTVRGDALDEINETLLLTLSNPVNANLTDDEGTGTITDDDAAPALAISNATVTESDTGASVDTTFTVSLSAASGRSVFVNYTTQAATATSPADFASDSGTLFFAPGETTKTVTVSVEGDLLNEAVETYNVVLSAPVGATIADATGVGTITDNDPLPNVSIAAPAAPTEEPDAGTIAMTFTVALSTPSGRTVTVAYATANNTATAGSDYNAAMGTVTFAPGETTKSITVAVRGDTTNEPNETFLVNLANPVNASIVAGQGQATGTILNDD
jgi:hypothetical protein